MFHCFRAAVLALGIAGALFHVAPSVAGPVNINTADAATLARELKGIGLKRAQAIVVYRGQYGPFRSADELALVKGIGPKVIEANRADIRVDPRPAATANGTRMPAKPGPVGMGVPRNATVAK
jgi:competence protein ComEA